MSRLLTTVYLAVMILVSMWAPVLHARDANSGSPQRDYSGTRKNVLVLVSAYKADTWSEAITRGVETVFAASPDTIGIWTEYMDATRFTTSDAKRVLSRLYRQKYAGLKFDAIVTIGEPAVNFALTHRKALFTGTPIIFSGVNPEQAKEALAAGAIAGVSEVFNYRQTLDAALRLLPDTKKIIFISPEMKNRQAADLLLPDYRPDIDVEIWHTPELAQILSRVSRIASQAIVMPLAEPGRSPQYSKSQDRFMDALTALSPVPVVSVWDVGLGHGILGGYLTPGLRQGVLAGSRALDLMHGKSPIEPKLTNVSADRLSIDRDALKRFAIESDRLPDDVDIQPLEPGHRRWLRENFQKIALVFFLLAIITAVLLYLLISRRKAQAALAESEARFRSVFDHLPMSLTLRDLQGRFLLVNTTFEKRLHLAKGAADGQMADTVFNQDFATILREQDLEVIARNSAVEREHTFTDESVEIDRTLLVVKFPVRDAKGNIHSIGTCALDISERNRAMEALVKSELRFQSLYDNAPDIYFTLGSNGQISAVNRYGADYLGYAKSELEGTSILDLIDTADRDKVQQSLADLSRVDMPESEPKHEFRLIRKDTTRLWVNMRVHVVMGSMKKDLSLWAICRDISTAHQLSEELSYQASHDSLTGLVNRGEFERRLQRIVRHLQDNQAQHALCFLDLDQFKALNDTCGHIAGDELLRQLGQVLKHRLRNRDIVARVGGDEFAILIEHCPVQQACTIAEKIRSDVELYRFKWQEQIFSIGVSIGITAIDVGAGTAEDVLTAADSACYLAKAQGRNRIHVYIHDSIAVARQHGEGRWIMRLQQALDENRFELWSQPIKPMDAENETTPVERVDILLRLRDDDGKLLDADQFMPGVERFGFGVRVDRLMICLVFDWLSSNPNCSHRYTSCFIPLTAAAITEETFLEFVNERLTRAGLSARCICFVLTETVAISNFAVVENFIAALKPQGCRFALGNFGAGLPSFTHLKHLDIDYLKISGSLVKNITNDPVDLAMVDSIRHVGSVMQKKIIAEAVEDLPTFEILANSGVHFCQGTFTGAPLPLAELALLEVRQEDCTQGMDSDTGKGANE